MSVHKYRSIEDMPDAALRYEPGDPRIAGSVRYLWRMSSALCDLRIPRGVHKYRSIEEMSADRERWEQERVDRIRAERLRDKN